MKNTDKNQPPPKREITSFETPSDLRRDMEIAVRITGKSKKDLILEALRKHLPEIVNASEEELAALREEFDRIVGRNKS